ncbi:MAG: hypothetical protein GY814_13160 [Gammaproteobacteria bacterium]|nr:hypothetical protein [Gammaproteobacteria bacterium]
MESVASERNLLSTRMNAYNIHYLWQTDLTTEDENDSHHQQKTGLAVIPSLNQM